MPSSPSPRPREMVIAGRYEVRQRLGAGSTGTVYLAFDTTAGRLVALKIIRTERLVTDSVPRIQDEFRALAPLQHPRIAAVYDFGYTDRGRIPYYTREYVAGATLPGGPPTKEPPGTYLRPILDLLEALHELHERNVLHLDIHAGNLIVCDDTTRGSVLIDVGLARSGGPRRSIASGELWPAVPAEILRRGELTTRTDLAMVSRNYRAKSRDSSPLKKGLSR